jgi:glycosyltransferase involved in cell wall biosynthesis
MQEQIELPAWVQWHGPVTPEQLCNDWFPTAQGLLTLSQHAEGRPQVMLEALASGLPIVASRLPAHDDLLGTGEGGILCGSAAETLAAIDALSDRQANRALGQRGRARMQETIGSWDDCAARFVTLYQHLLEKSKA